MGCCRPPSDSDDELEEDTFVYTSGRLDSDDE